MLNQLTWILHELFKVLHGPISAHATLPLGCLFIARASFLFLHLPTCHAKACIKRHVAQKVIQRKAVVKDAQSFYDYTKEFIIPSIPILLIKKDELFCIKKWVHAVRKCSRIKMYFQFTLSFGKVLIKRYSSVLEALYSNIIPASLQTKHTTNKCIDSKGIEVNDCVKIIH